MKPENAPISTFVSKVICSIFGHRYHVSKNITDHVKEYCCSSCGEEITDTANGTLEKLTAKFRETNAYLAEFHQRRSRKIYSEAS